MSRILVVGALAAVIAAVDVPEPPIQVSHQLAGSLLNHTVVQGETLGSIGASGREGYVSDNWRGSATQSRRNNLKEALWLSCC